MKNDSCDWNLIEFSLVLFVGFGISHTKKQLPPQIRLKIRIYELEKMEKKS